MFDKIWQIALPLVLVIMAAAALVVVWPGPTVALIAIVLALIVGLVESVRTILWFCHKHEADEL